MNTLGEKLKAARIEKKLSQIEVAEKLLVSRQTISKWENNVCLPDLDNFQKICELYGFSSSEVLNRESEATISEKQEELVDAEKVYYLIAKKIVIDFLEGFCKISSFYIRNLADYYMYRASKSVSIRRNAPFTL